MLTIAPKKVTPAKLQAEKKVTPSPDVAPQPKITVAQVPLNWDKVLEHIQANYIAIYSVLSRCTPSVDVGTLTLYTGNGFYKKKLDDIRYRTNIILSLEALGMSGLDIETIGTPPPPQDKVAASVAAVMGGGEEYSIEEIGKKT